MTTYNFKGNYYEILGVYEDVDTKQIISAYRKAALKWHPDKNPNADEELFKKITKGNQKRDYCYIENIIEAIFLALKAKKNDGEVINIGSGNPKTVKTLVKCINRLIGKGKPLFGAINYRNYENKNIYPDIKKANKKLKWKPKISVLKGLELTINYYKGILKINE